MPIDQWLTKRIAFINALKAPTESQRMLVELASIAEPTKQESRDLDALVKLEKLNERAEEAKVAALKVVAERKEAARKARTRQLIELGGIVEMLDFPVDRGTLCGALLWALDQAKTDPSALNQLKTRGDKFIADREAEKKTVGGNGGQAADERLPENVAG